MRDLKKIIDEYLSTPTEYALQIVGNWGHGKTYYYKNYIANLIENKETLKDPKKKYKPIYISLFGLKSTEDIATKVVIEFYASKFFKPYIKNESGRKKLKITESILKIGFRGFLNYRGLGELNEYATDVKNIGKNVLSTDELVLCFDDLERKDSSLDIRDLIGYINSLLDEKVKIILISNDDILKKFEIDYKNLKEKIIGIKVDYSVNLRLTLREIITTKFLSSEFRQFLNEHINLLEEISEAAGKNFRHIIYALNVLHFFFNEFRINIFEPKHEIAVKLKEQLGNVSRLIFALAIEYKSSELSYKDLKTYNTHSQLFSFGIANNGSLSVNENNNSPLTLFIEKYKIDKNAYFFYESIFNYVTFKDEFVIEEFINDFKNKFHLDNGLVLPQYGLTNELSPDNYFNFSDEECLDKFELVFEFVDAGVYRPDDYLSIMFLVQRFHEIFDVDLEKAYERLVCGLTKSIQKAGDNHEVLFDQFEGRGKSSMYSDHQSKLYDIGIAEIKLFNESKKKKRLNEIIEYFLKDYKEFQQKFISEKDFQYEVSYMSFFRGISSQIFIDHIKKNENGVIKFLINFFKQRYHNKEEFEEESSSIETYSISLAEYSTELLEMNDNKIRKRLINDLKVILSDIKSKFKKEE